MQTLNIRVDAGPQIGTGHLMRCLALAQGWRDSGGSVTFITTCQNNDLLHRIKDQEFNARILKHQYPDPLDWKHTQSMLPDSGNAWIVLDGYHFDEVYQQRIRDAGHPLLVIDDTVHLKHYYADIILNQNLAAEKLSYETEPSTRLLLGTKYALLRKEFLACRRRQTEIPTIGRRLLVSLGGSDSDNHTLKVIHSIQLVDISDLEAIVVIGPSNPHMTELETAIEQSPASIRLIRNANNMPDLMTWADMAISSAGTTTWELLFLGIPSLFLILADNQSPIGKQIQSQKAGKTLGWAKDIPTRRLADSITELANDLELRTEMVASARQMVDGLGVHRVVHKMQQRQVARLKLRQVNSTDFDTLLDWANETTVRAYSFSSDPITETEHANWLNGKFNDPNCIFYIIENNRSEPIGQIRFDIDNAGNAEISTSIDVKNRNKGYASSAIELACQRIIQLPHVKKILAYIKQENTASIRTFANADFAFKELIEFKGHAAFEMTWPI